MTAQVMREDELGPEPSEGEVGDKAALEVWLIWCSKATILRFGELRDSVEICCFHNALEQLEAILGPEETHGFILQAFPVGHGARSAGLRPIAPGWRPISLNPEDAD
jgi:hypothetical protein